MTGSEPNVRRFSMALVLLAGAAVAVVLGVLGAVRDPGGQPLPTWGFSSVQSFKAWLGSLVLLLVVAQALTALWMYGRLPGVGFAPPWGRRVHRVTGGTAFLLSLPVAFYCLYRFGFAQGNSTPRTVFHASLGCLFYGAFTSKMIALRSRRLPEWMLPVLGGTVFTVFVLLWAASALWWFRTVGVGR